MMGAPRAGASQHTRGVRGIRIAAWSRDRSIEEDPPEVLSVLVPADESSSTPVRVHSAKIDRVGEHIDYVELPGGDLATTKAFYTTAFGWGFVDYGPTYAGFEDAGIDGGLAADDAGTSATPLVLLKTDVLEDALARVEAAGGVVTVPIFEFPGGRRFHFRDPAGNELGVWAE